MKVFLSLIKKNGQVSNKSNTVTRQKIKAKDFEKYLIQMQPSSKIVLCNYSLDNSKLSQLLVQHCTNAASYSFDYNCPCFSSTKIRCICILKMLRLHFKSKVSGEHIHNWSAHKLRSMINASQDQFRIIIRCEYTTYPEFNIEKMLKGILFWPKSVHITLILINHKHAKLNNLQRDSCLDNFVSKKQCVWIDID